MKSNFKHTQDEFKKQEKQLLLLKKRYPLAKLYVDHHPKKGWTARARGPFGQAQILLTSFNSLKSLEFLCQIVSITNIKEARDV